MPTQVLTAEQKQFIVASNMEGVTDGEVVDSFLELKSNQYASAPIGTPRLATKGNGTNLYGTIPTWTVTGPYEIEFDVVFPTTTVGSIKVFFDSADANNRTFFYLSATGALRFSGATTMYVDGVAAADNSVSQPLDGAVHHIKLVNTGTVNVTNIYRKYDDTYYNTCAMFNLRLTDVNNPANSRFYPLDNTYGRTYSGRALESTQTLVDHFNDTDFYYWQLVSGTATIDGVTIPSSAGRFLVGSTIVAQSGANLRFNFEAGVIKIDHHFVMQLEVLSGDCTTFYADICDSAGGTATLSGNVITIQGIRTSDKAADATYKFVDFSPSGGTSITFKVLSITQTPVLQWYNRTSGDVITVYPDAIKPGQEFWFAFRYKVTDVSKNSGFNYLLSIGSKTTGKSGYLIYLPESNGQFGIDQYNNGTRVVNHFGRDFGTTQLDGLTHTAVVHIKTDGSFEYWVDSETPKYSSGTSLPAFAIEYLHLNGYSGAAGSSLARMGANINYFFIYNSLDPSDIPYILQGDNPALFGEVRQGYLLNGDTSEILNQEPLTLYPVEDPPKFQDVVRNYIKSWFMNMMGWIT